jgi:hypothetical protein
MKLQHIFVFLSTLGAACAFVSSGRHSFVPTDWKMNTGMFETYTLDGQDIRGPITPLGNFVLVRIKDTLSSTSGGILLPDQVRTLCVTGSYFYTHLL